MKSIKIFGVFAAFLTSVNAASISFDMIADTLAVSPSTGILGPAYTMYLGKCNIAGLNSGSRFAEISSGFTVLSTTSFLGGDAAGYVSSGDVFFTDAAGFSNSQLFVWFSDGAAQNALITGFGNIPADASIPNAVSFALDSSNAPFLTYVLGTYIPTINSGNGGAVMLTGMPEPSAALLAAMGALSLLRRRRN
jgi:hypothetical protein